MPQPAARRLQPRKKPSQARSTASVEAILQATIQVLLTDGKGKLTTTRIAERAGVSVGTLYQYFPNKSSLLQALLKEHLDGVAAAVESACGAVHGAPVAKMAEAIAVAFARAKFHNIDRSAAMYAVSDDVEGKRVARPMQTRAKKAITAALASIPKNLIEDPELVAATLWGAMAGVSRATLEGNPTRSTVAKMEGELVRLARAYLQASARASKLPQS